MNCKICGKPTKIRNGVPNWTCGRECNLILNKMKKPDFGKERK